MRTASRHALALVLVACVLGCEPSPQRHAPASTVGPGERRCPTADIARAVGYDADDCPDVSTLVAHVGARSGAAGALAAARELTRLAPDRPDPWELVARIALAGGDEMTARAALRAAMRIREPIAWDGPLVIWGLSDVPCARPGDLTRALLDTWARRGLEPEDELLVVGWEEPGEEIVRGPPVLRSRPAALRSASCHQEGDDAAHGVVAFEGGRDVPLTLARATLGDARVLVFAETASERDVPGRLCRTFEAQGAPVLVETCGGLVDAHRYFRVLDRRRRVLVPEHPVRAAGGEPQLLWVDASGSLRLVWMSVGEGRCGAAHQAWVTRLDEGRAVEGRLYVGGVLPRGCSTSSRG